MSKTVKQIDISNALERVKKGDKVFAISFGQNGKVIIKNFNKLEVGDVLVDDSEYIFVVFED